MKTVLFPFSRWWTIGMVLCGLIMTGAAQSLPLAITNAAEAKAEGEALVQEILAQQPAEEVLASGKLTIRNGRGQKIEKPIRFETKLNAAGWTTVYEAATGTNHQSFIVRHTSGSLPQYAQLNGSSEGSGEIVCAADNLMKPFANSDFWLVDLGLDFLRWPGQRLARKELRRTRSCRVLESTQPEPAPGGYAKVVTWVDRESLGIVYAEAHDAAGKKLKEFSPKVVKQSGGQWQLQEMEIRNVQTGSSSRIVFDQPSGQ